MHSPGEKRPRRLRIKLRHEQSGNPSYFSQMDSMVMLSNFATLFHLISALLVHFLVEIYIQVVHINSQQIKLEQVEWSRHFYAAILKWELVWIMAGTLLAAKCE